MGTWCEELTHWKRPRCWERLRVRGEGDDRGWDGWMASPTQWTWVGNGQGGLAGWSPWGCKELDTTKQLNWELEILILHMTCICGLHGNYIELNLYCLEGGGWCFYIPLQLFPKEISDFSTVVRLSEESEFSASVGGLHMAIAWRHFRVVPNKSFWVIVDYQNYVGTMF